MLKLFNKSKDLLVKCPACGREVSRDIKRCPQCGKKLRMGWFKKLVIYFLFISVVSGLISEGEGKRMLKEQSTVKDMKLQVDGFMGFAEMTNGTDVAIKSAKKKYLGKVTQISYEVTGVKNSLDYSGCLAIDRKFNSTIEIGQNVFRTILCPATSEERAQLENIRVSDLVTVKGKIHKMEQDGFDMVMLIAPAILVHKDAGNILYYQRVDENETLLKKDLATQQ